MHDLRTAADQGDRLAASNAHRAFHLALVALAANHQLVVTYEPLIVRLPLYITATLRREATPAHRSRGYAGTSASPLRS